MLTDILAEERPAVNGTDTAVEKECGDSRADPLVLAPCFFSVFHFEIPFQNQIIFYATNNTTKYDFFQSHKYINIIVL